LDVPEGQVDGLVRAGIIEPVDDGEDLWDGPALITMRLGVYQSGGADV